MSRGLERGLRYSFAPVPRWLIQGAIEGEISPEARWLHEVLYHRADTQQLQRRGETPVLLRTTLAAALRRNDDSSLARLICRERERGRLDYRVTGSRHTGYGYAFTLFPDGPRLSDKSPTEEQAGGPTEKRAGSRSGTGACESTAALPVRPTDPAQSADVSDPDPLLSDRAGPKTAVPSGNPRRRPMCQSDRLRLFERNKTVAVRKTL
jgi:hypothetical protein